MAQPECHICACNSTWHNLSASSLHATAQGTTWVPHPYMQQHMAQPECHIPTYSSAWHNMSASSLHAAAHGTIWVPHPCMQQTACDAISYLHKALNHCVRFEIGVFWVLRPCSLVDRYRRSAAGTFLWNAGNNIQNLEFFSLNVNCACHAMFCCDWCEPRWHCCLFV
jgi:hypothetical protein